MIVETLFQPSYFDASTRQSFHTEGEVVRVRDAMPDGLHIGERGVVAHVEHLGGESSAPYALEVDDDGRVLKPGERLTVTYRPGWEAELVWKIVFSLATMAASALITKSLAGKLGNQVDDDQANESYRGFSNSFTPGGQIPIVLGERRLAPPVVGKVVESSFSALQLSNRETLRLLLAICHGPIEGLKGVTGTVATNADLVSVAGDGLSGSSSTLADAVGLEINGQPASNFSDVLLQWRTGEVEQDPILGFPDSSEDVAVEQALEEYSDAIDISNTGFPSGVYTFGSEIDSGLGDFLSVTMDDPADRFVITLLFPQGIYKDNGGGGLAPTTAKFRVQYWPVDSGGTRTGDTLILPELEVSGAEQLPQVWQYPEAFYEPSTYVPSNQFGYISCDANSDHAKITAPINPGTFPASFADPDALRFSIGCWVRADGQGLGGVRPIFLSQKGSLAGGSLPNGINWPYYPTGSGSGDSGMMFCLEYGGAENWHLALYTWTGLTFGVRYSKKLPGPTVDEWRHVGIAWDGVTGQVTWYVDGLEILDGGTLGSGDKPAMYEEGDAFFGHAGTAGSDNYTNDLVGPVSLCNFALAQGVKSETWFAFAANNQNAQGLTLTPYDVTLDPDLLIHTRLSEEIASGKIEQKAFPLSTTSGEVVETVGSPLQAAPQGDGPIWDDFSGEPLRGRYHIELYRSNPVLEDPLEEINAADWKALTLILDEDFSHPMVAMGAVSIDADDQVSNGQPTTSMVVRGSKVKVWSGVSAQYPTFVEQWTRNPAWNVLHVLTTQEIGFGAIWRIDRNIDLPAWQDFADYCEQGVEDAAGTPAFFDGDPVAISGSHPYGEVHFKIGILDNTAVSTGEALPDTWEIGSTLRIKTASDSSWTVASADNAKEARLTITAIRWESDDTAANGYQHWVQIEADWIDGYTLPSASNVTGTATGVEDRHQCDALLVEKGADGWTAIVEILRSFRAAPIVLGNKLSVYVQKARPVDWIITQAQMIPDSFSRRWSGIDDRYNSLQLEFVDRAKGYEVDFVTEDHPSISGESLNGSIRKAPPETLRAVTRRTEVRRQAIFRLNQYYLLRRSYSLQVGYESRAYAVGDRVLIAHDAVLAGFSGRVYADASSATSIKLDRDLVVTNGNTYELIVRSNASVTVDSEEIRETVSIDASMIPGSGSSTLAAGSAITLTAPGFQAMLPEQGDPYTFGETGTATLDATIVKIDFDPATMIRTVHLVEYDEDVFTDNAFGELGSDPGGALPPAGQSGSLIKRPGDAYGNFGGGVLGAKEATRLRPDGKPKVVVGITFPKLPETGGGQTSIYAATVEADRPVTPQLVGQVDSSATSAEVDADRFRPGQRVRFFVQQRARGGVARPPRACPRVDLVIGGRALTPAAPTIETPQGRTGNSVYSVSFPSGIIPEGVEVRVGGWILGQKVAAALRDGDLVSSQWVYGADNSAGDGPFTHQVRSLLPNGQVSAAATFENGDAVPLGMTVEHETAHEDAWASGTLASLQIDSSYTPPALKFNLSQLQGTFVTPTVDMGVKKRWFVEVVADGHQVHPSVLADLTEVASSRVYANWLGEGPTGGEDAEMCRVTLEWKPSETGSIAGSWGAFRPGEHYFRAAQFRLRINRPTSDFDVRIKRFSVRVLAIADFEMGDIDAGTL